MENINTVQYSTYALIIVVTPEPEPELEPKIDKSQTLDHEYCPYTSAAIVLQSTIYLYAYWSDTSRLSRGWLPMQYEEVLYFVLVCAVRIIHQAHNKNNTVNNTEQDLHGVRLYYCSVVLGTCSGPAG